MLVLVVTTRPWQKNRMRRLFGTGLYFRPQATDGFPAPNRTRHQSVPAGRKQTARNDCALKRAQIRSLRHALEIFI
jgi:hypothetical protein